MRDQLADLKNLFSHKDIIDRKMHPFAGTARDKITILNTAGTYIGKFTDLLAVLNAAYNPFHVAMLKLPTDLTLGAGSVEIVDKVMSDAKQFYSNYKGMIKDTFFKDHHEIYIQFYVDDLKDYNAMTLTNALELMTRYANAAHTNVAALTPEFDAKAASFVTRFNAATAGKSIATDAISDDRSTRNEYRDALDDALFEMYNFCKYIFKCDYPKMHNIFPLETLMRHPRHEILHLNGSVDALATVNLTEALYDNTYIAKVRSLSNCDLLAGLALTATTAIDSTNGVLIAAMQTKSFIISSTGTPDDHFLNITNLNLTEVGLWQVEISKQS